MEIKNIFISVSILFFIITVNAFGQKPESIFSKNDMEKNWGKNCLIYGTYKTMMLPKSQNPESPLLPSNRIVIILSDSTELALETHDKGLRDITEKEKFIDRQVVVSGTLRHWAQLWGSSEEASIIIDAIIDIETIELIN